jgi:hypothetical protein
MKGLSREDEGGMKKGRVWDQEIMREDITEDEDGIKRR